MVCVIVDFVGIMPVGKLASHTGEIKFPSVKLALPYIKNNKTDYFDISLRLSNVPIKCLNLLVDITKAKNHSPQCEKKFNLYVRQVSKTWSNIFSNI